VLKPDQAALDLDVSNFPKRNGKSGMASGSFYSPLDRPLNEVGPGFSNGTSESAGCRVVAIVVTFNPSRKKLEQLLQAVRPQAQGVVIVDNTPAGGADLRDFTRQRATWRIKDSR
jgi:hypothetical protein